MTEPRPVVLVVAPMPPLPANAGNRRRLVAVCALLMRNGFSVDLAYYAHEDQVYRRFGQHPPADDAGMAGLFRQVFRIEPRAPIRLTSRGRCFGIDDWCPDEIGDFVAWYWRAHPGTRTIVVNYVFLSRCLERVPAGVARLIDTHDRFADRQAMYRPFGLTPSFFYTDAAGEAVGFGRADLILAIQGNEAAYFRTLTDRPVLDLPPRMPQRRPPRTVSRIGRIGFVGHGNDANRLSIEAFAEAWTRAWEPGLPELVVAGEVCVALAVGPRPGLVLLGPVPSLDGFYDTIDAVVAPMLMGTGLKMKVAEALSYGLPVIGTAIAFDGFEPVVREHRLSGAEAVRDRILALHTDETGLADLCAACATLFARFEARCAEAEARLMEHLGGGRTDRPPPQPRPLPPAEILTARIGAAVVACETGLRALETSSPDLGTLVATERVTDAGAGRAYAAIRRRWFARARGEEGADTGPQTEQRLREIVRGSALSLAPEWLHERSLAPALREAVAGLLAESEPDWWSAGVLLGSGGGRIDLVTHLPSALLKETRCAAFLCDASGRNVAEMTLSGAAPLLRPLDVQSGSGYDLALVPAHLTLDAADAGRGAEAIEPGRILILTDFLLGRLDVVDDAPPVADSRA